MIQCASWSDVVHIWLQEERAYIGCADGLGSSRTGRRLLPYIWLATGQGLHAMCDSIHSHSMCDGLDSFSAQIDEFFEEKKEGRPACTASMPADRIPRLSILLGLAAFLILRLAFAFRIIYLETNAAVVEATCISTTNDVTTCAAAYAAAVAHYETVFSTWKAFWWALIAAVPLAVVWVVFVHLAAWHEKRCRRGVEFHERSELPGFIQVSGLKAGLERTHLTLYAIWMPTRKCIPAPLRQRVYPSGISG